MTTEQPHPPSNSMSMMRRQRWLDRLVSLTDDQFKIPGTDIRFGLDPVIGFLFPVIGDNVTGLLAGTLLLVAWKDGAPPILLARMAGNIALDVLAGLVPIIGDIVDVTFRANRRNLALLRTFQRERYGVFASEEGVGSYSLVTHDTNPSWLLGLVVITVLVVILSLPIAFLFLIAQWILR